MLTALNNQVSLSADQQEKAKPIVDKHVADLEAVKNDTTLDKAHRRDSEVSAVFLLLRLPFTVRREKSGRSSLA